MILVLTAVIAFPLGFALRSWLSANLAYGLTFLFVYVFQSASLVVAWTLGDEAAFGRPADADAAFVAALPYLAASAAIFTAGFVLVAVGHAVRRRWDRSRSGVELEPALSTGE
jgi:hypothetical protein